MPLVSKRNILFGIWRFGALNILIIIYLIVHIRLILLKFLVDKILSLKPIIFILLLSINIRALWSYSKFIFTYLYLINVLVINYLVYFLYFVKLDRFLVFIWMKCVLLVFIYSQIILIIIFLFKVRIIYVLLIYFVVLLILNIILKFIFLNFNH